MRRDDSEESVYQRLADVCQQIYDALLDGIKKAVYFHDAAEWDHKDDPHLYFHIIRRSAIEYLKQLAPSIEDGDNDRPPMSGLIIRQPDDLIRVWHTAAQRIPKPDTHSKRDFVKQSPSGQMPLFSVPDLSRLRGSHSNLNHVIIQWTNNDHIITRYDLVRPVNIKRGAVTVEWRRPLLGGHKPA
ncbi:hypothetical protein GCM10010149_23850 [Nonomuraea roseoviolacea subsp. roseoviolacea]|uniref:hypothetical protein n=1 Tax=Nonomuraea roseoviolacea TaxID=103837 RepID=UPI0031D5DD47